MHRADAAGVGQGDRGTGVVVRRELAVAGSLDEVLVGVPELGKVHGLGLLDVGNHQEACAIGLGHVNGDAKVDMGGLDSARLSLNFVLVRVFCRGVGGG